jgi:mycothiol synthase
MNPNLPQLHLRRSLDRLPPLVVPAGYALRSLTPQDLEAWTSLLVANAELGVWTSERAAPLFAPDSPMLFAASYFATHDGRPVATAQLDRHGGPPYAPLPELGWVAALPEYRGRGLGYAVCLAVLHGAAAAGYLELFLRTDDHRLSAIRTYLRLGFTPWLIDPSAEERWQRIYQALGQN